VNSSVSYFWSAAACRRFVTGFAIEYQSGVVPPHSKELLPQTNAI